MGERQRRRQIRWWQREGRRAEGPADARVLRDDEPVGARARGRARGDRARRAHAVPGDGDARRVDARPERALEREGHGLLQVGAVGVRDPPVPVWKSTSGTPCPAKTSNLSSSAESKSIRLILGRIDRSRRVLEAQPKSLRRNCRIRSH